MSELAFNRAILEVNNQRLFLVLILSIVINLVLGSVVLINVHKPPLLVYQNDQTVETMDYELFQIDETILIDFVRMISKDYLSFRFESLPDQIKSIEKYLMNQPLQSILHSHKKSSNRLNDKQVIQQFDIDSIEIVKTSNPYHVEIRGVKNIYVDGMHNSKQSVYAFEVKQIKASEDNPYGLVITEVLERELKDEEDEK